MRLFVNVYVGQTRAAGLIEKLSSYGFGELVCGPSEFPPRRLPFAVDNERYKVFTGSVTEEAWGARFEKLQFEVWASGAKPDFLVVPDLVARGMESLRWSLDWVPRLKKLDVPLYLAVQDGMSFAGVRGELGPFAGLFVGGSLPWKIATGEDWVKFAHEHGRQCHIGRAGTEKRVRWAVRIGADSADSCLPLWSKENLARFLRGLSTSQAEMFA